MSNAGQDTETVFLGLALKHSKVHTIGESICTQENVKLSETRESVHLVKSTWKCVTGKMGRANRDKRGKIFNKYKRRETCKLSRAKCTAHFVIWTVKFQNEKLTSIKVS